MKPKQALYLLLLLAVYVVGILGGRLMSIEQELPSTTMECDEWQMVDIWREGNEWHMEAYRVCREVER